MAVSVGQQAARDAWRELRLGGEPCAVDELQVPGRGKKTSVYRLVGAGTGATDIIAKRARREKAEVERIVYERVLPSLPVRTLRYYGVLADPEPDRMWIFVEDAGDERYSVACAEHRVMASRWLGLLHAALHGAETSALLPCRASGYYRQELRAARQGLLDNIGNPALSTDDAVVLRAIVVQLDALEAHWNDVESRLATMPLTVVHGDFAERNLRLRAGALMPFDWETAHWGSPAVDLAQILVDAEDALLRAYLESVQQCWPHVGEHDVRFLAALGNVLRCIMSIRAEHYGLDWKRWLERGADFAAKYAKWTMTELGQHRGWLERAMDALPREA